jgi:hypothetical protein
MTPVEEAVYVASRASIPERPAMWQRLRKQGWNISSTWIDEAGEGETGSFSELWQRITDEIRRSAGVVLYVEPEDLPLKGAYIEIGMALGMGKPVAVVATPATFGRWVRGQCTRWLSWRRIWKRPGNRCSPDPLAMGMGNDRLQSEPNAAPMTVLNTALCKMLLTTR